ncbi:hypothetical protein DFA_03021 [Cavenderia fasciculata]|uniref:Uncharacterized protein n=1 Tax=Cavenderia fasciculata TaxID=261658 RepID=F4PGE3_CACFS|nr:uncharacterized protein DFA_03021 [Cavenderia fasciculata]EGG24777.1 hypothetical protein DFA_03021 [Cavenderia fasciculata]|eukprot:XP_004362628.1 hypothetical protein DFA_03021 [Cavenderia fasciculata]
MNIDNLFKHIIIKNQYTRQKIFNHVSIIHQQLNIPIVKYQHIKCSLYTLIQYNFTSTFIQHFKRVYDQLKSIKFDNRPDCNDFDRLYYILDIVLVKNNTRALTFMLDFVKLANSTPSSSSSPPLCTVDCSTLHNKMFYSLTVETVMVLLDSGIKITNKNYTRAIIESLLLNGQLEILKTRLSKEQLIDYRIFSPLYRENLFLKDLIDTKNKNESQVVEILHFMNDNNLLVGNDWKFLLLSKAKVNQYNLITQHITTQYNDTINNNNNNNRRTFQSTIQIVSQHLRKEYYKVMVEKCIDSNTSSMRDMVRLYFGALLTNNKETIERCKEYFSNHTQQSITTNLTNNELLVFREDACRLGLFPIVRLLYFESSFGAKPIRDVVKNNHLDNTKYLFSLTKTHQKVAQLFIDCMSIANISDEMFSYLWSEFDDKSKSNGDIVSKCIHNINQSLLY